jgi:hypothetical protein
MKWNAKGSGGKDQLKRLCKIDIINALFIGRSKVQGIVSFFKQVINIFSTGY